MAVTEKINCREGELHSSTVWLRACRRKNLKQSGNDARVGWHGIICVQHSLDRHFYLTKIAIEYSRHSGWRVRQCANQYQDGFGISDRVQDEEVGVVAGPGIRMSDEVLGDRDTAVSKLSTS